MSEKQQLPKATYVKLAPIDLKLNVDEEFEEFVKNKAKGQEVEAGKKIGIELLKHLIPFKVKCCQPEKAVIGEKTVMKILNVDTHENMKLSESCLNIFMTDNQVRKILSDNITEKLITQGCAVMLWKELKKAQSELIPELTALVNNNKSGSE